MLATAAAVHRGVSQRLLQELVQRLGVHILSGRPVQVSQQEPHDTPQSGIRRS